MASGWSPRGSYAETSLNVFIGVFFFAGLVKTAKHKAKEMGADLLILLWYSPLYSHRRLFPFGGGGWKIKKADADMRPPEIIPVTGLFDKAFDVMLRF